MTRAVTHDIQVGVPVPLLMAPSLLLLPFLVIGCVVARVPVNRALGAFLKLLWSLRGTHVEIAVNHYCFFIHIL